MDRQRSYHHGRDRIRRAVAGLGYSAVWVGRRPDRDGPILLRHLLLLHPPRRLLPVRRPREREAELHLHGRRSDQPRRGEVQVLRLHPVHQPLRCQHRIYHRLLHQHDGDPAFQLLPLEGRQQPVPRLEQLLHDRVRCRGDTLVSDPRLRPDLVALHRRRRHVLHLLLHRPPPRHPPSHIQRCCQGEPHRHQHWHRHPDPEDMAELPGSGQHRLRLFLLRHPHRNPGHHQVTSLRIKDDEEGNHDKRRDHDHLLHGMRVHGLRRLRRPRAGKPPHGLRLLQPLLAPRHRQRRHRHPPRGRLPGLLPAPLRLHREVGHQPLLRLRLHHPGDPRPPPRLPLRHGRIQPQPIPPRVAVGLRGDDDGDLHAPPLLQRRRGDPRRARVLAPHSLLSCGDVHLPEEDSEVEHEVGVPADAERRVPHHLHRRRRGVHRRGRARPQGVPPIQDHVLSAWQQWLAAEQKRRPPTNRRGWKISSHSCGGELAFSFSVSTLPSFLYP